MSISSFATVARKLYDENYHYEALALACIAIDACATLEYPEQKNAERYKAFLKKYFKTITQHGFPGICAGGIKIKVNVPVDTLKPDETGYVDMNQIIYHVLRCGLVHNCNIEDDIIFTDGTYLSDWGENGFPLPKTIVLGLLKAVEENRCCLSPCKKAPTAL